MIQTRNIAICLALTAAYIRPAQIAFLKHNHLYVVPTNAAGEPIPGHKPFLVAKLQPLYHGDSVEISWTASGQVAIEHDVDAWNGPRRFGLSNKHRASGIWLVPPIPHSHLTHVTDGSEADFSPDGTKVAFTRERSKMVDGTDYLETQAYVRDLRTNKETTFGPRTEEPTWAPSGDKLALVEGPDEADAIVIVTYPSGKLISTVSESVNPCDFSFSPDGKWFAFGSHLSRPLTGDEIISLHGERGFNWITPYQYAPQLFEAWSPDSRSALCLWRVQDPNNDGDWLRSYLAIQGISGSSRNLGACANSGGCATFSPDGKAALWIDAKGNLVRLDLHSGKRPSKLLSKIDQFAVRCK